MAKGKIAAKPAAKKGPKVKCIMLMGSSKTIQVEFNKIADSCTVISAQDLFNAQGNITKMLIVKYYEKKEVE